MVFRRAYISANAPFRSNSRLIPLTRQAISGDLIAADSFQTDMTWTHEMSECPLWTEELIKEELDSRPEAKFTTLFKEMATSDYIKDSIELHIPLKTEHPYQWSKTGVVWEPLEEEDQKNPIMFNDSLIGITSENTLWEEWDMKMECLSPTLTVVAEETVESTEDIKISLTLLDRPLSVAFVGAEQGNTIIAEETIAQQQQHLPYYHRQIESTKISNAPFVSMSTPSSAMETLFINDGEWTANQVSCSTSTNRLGILNTKMETPMFEPLTFSEFYQPPNYSQHNIQANNMHINSMELNNGVANSYENLLSIASTSTQIPLIYSESTHTDSSPSSQPSGPLSEMSFSSSPSQNDILEEIHRECAEIEKRNLSTSPEIRSLDEMLSTATAKPKLRLTRRNARSQNGASSSSFMSTNFYCKKELNRIAATKYRQRKCAERKNATDQLRHLELRNVGLKSDVESVEAEIKYLKGLLREIENRAMLA